MVAISLVSTVIATALQLMVPILLGRAVDQTQALVSEPTTAETATAALWVTAGSVLLVWVLRGFFAVFQNYFSESVGHNVGYTLRLAYYEKIQRLSFRFHDRVHSGDLITLGMLDLEAVRMFFSTGLVRIVLQAGEVLEQGNHDELMALKELYARLYSVNYPSFDDLPAGSVDAGKTQKS